MYEIIHNFTYRQKDKGWQVLLSYKDGGKWRQKSRQGFRTKQQAKAAGERLYEELQAHFVPTSDSELRMATLQEFTLVYLNDKNAISDSTRYIVNRIPLFFKTLADTPLVKIDSAAITKALTNVAADYSTATLNLYIACLSAIFTHARKVYHLIRENPVTAVPRFKKKQKKRIHAISADDFELLLKAKTTMATERYKRACILAYYTGMRYGELTGLLWVDIDMGKRYITVKHQLKRTYDKNGYIEYYVGPLKTKNSYRDIPIPAALMPHLEQWLMDRTGPSVLEIENSHTSRCNQWIQRTLPITTIHDLRHTYATNLLMNGLDVKTVAALCGDTVHTILSTYIDYTDEMRRKAKNTVDRIFK